MLLDRVKVILNNYFIYFRSVFKVIENSRNPFLIFAPPGHFYSPIPNLLDIKKVRDSIFDRSAKNCLGINLHEQEQINLVKTLKKYYDQMPFTETKQDGYRYYFKNPYFGHGSGIILYSILRHFNPKRVIEVGSGFSSALMLDVDEHFLNDRIQFTFIEPYPERLLNLLSNSDKESQQIIDKPVQTVSKSIFEDLEGNDLLFIDSSHVVKIGSDVVHLITEILPLLKKGVIIHIHDIYWPFEYPENWILSGHAWNEAYLVKAFLQFNSSFQILLFNSFLSLHHRDLMEQNFPQFITDGGSSLWMVKAT